MRIDQFKSGTYMPAGDAMFIGVGGEESGGLETVRTVSHPLPQNGNIA
jgi:hypothetical protein